MLWQIGCLAQTEAELVIRHGAPASCIAYVCGEVGKPCPLPGLAFVSFSPWIKTALGCTVYDRYNPRPPSMTAALCLRIRRSTQRRYHGDRFVPHQERTERASLLELNDGKHYAALSSPSLARRHPYWARFAQRFFGVPGQPPDPPFFSDRPRASRRALQAS